MPGRSFAGDWRHMVALVLIAAAAACQVAPTDADQADPGTTTMGEAAPAGTLSDVLAAPADPLDVDIELGPESVTEIIGRDGGVVEVPVGDGRIHRVMFEPETFALDTEITATLVVGVSGADGIEVDTGVQLEPHGTVLARPATVSLELADTSTDDLWGFSTAAEGEQFYPTVGFASEGRLDIPIITFSSYEAGFTSLEVIAALAEANPVTSVGRRVAAQVAMILEQHPDAVLPDGLPGEVWVLLEAWWRRGVEALSEEAIDDDIALMKLVHEAMWQTLITQMLGAEDRAGLPRVADAVAVPIDNAIERAVERCKDEHRLGELGYIVELDATRSLLGIVAERLDFDSIVAECARFRLVFESTFTQEGSAQGVENRSISFVVGEVEPLYPLTAAIQVLASGSDADLVGTGPLEYRVAEGTSVAELPGGTCEATYVGGVDSEMMAVLTSVALRPRRYGPWSVPEIYGDVSSPTDPSEPAEVRVGLDPGDPIEKTMGSCPGSGRQNLDSATWDVLFAVRHVMESIQGEDWAGIFSAAADPGAVIPEQTGFLLDLEEFVGGRIYATGTWEGCSGGTAEGGVFGETCERTFITLYHEPSP